MNFKMNYTLMALAATISLSSCDSGTSEIDAAAAGLMQPVEADFIILQKSNAETQAIYPGSIEGSVNVDVKPQVAGYLQSVFVKEGDYVQKGQSLFRIRPEVYEEQVNSSNAALKAALANQASARVEVEKTRLLVEGKVVSDIQLKTAEAAYDAAKAQVQQAKAALASSKINADFTLIKAPVSGYIGRIPYRLGSLVTPSDAAPLTTLSEVDTVFVYFSMSEADYIAYKKEGETITDSPNAKLILADGSLYAYKGELETASGNVDPATGSISMKAVFPNPNKLMRSGGAAKVVIQHSINGVMEIPKIAVKDIQDKFFVYLLADSSNVMMVPVEISGGTADRYFIQSGVKPGDKVAVNRLDLIQMGATVKPKIVSLDAALKE